MEPTYFQLNDKWVCNHCKREFNSRQATTLHIYRVHVAPDKMYGGNSGKSTWNRGLTKETNASLQSASEKISQAKQGKPGHHKLKGCTPWNKGLTKVTDKRVAELGQTISLNTKGRVGIPLSDDAKLKISRALSSNNKGGRSKWYDVDGQRVQGTWERDIAIKLTENQIRWLKLTKKSDSFEYLKDGNQHHYTPDFFLTDLGVYLEIKGFWWGDDKNKMEIILNTYPDKKFIIIEETDYKKILSGDLSPIMGIELVK